MYIILMIFVLLTALSVMNLGLMYYYNSRTARWAEGAVKFVIKYDTEPDATHKISKYLMKIGHLKQWQTKSAIIIALGIAGVVAGSIGAYQSFTEADVSIWIPFVVIATIPTVLVLTGKWITGTNDYVQFCTALLEEVNAVDVDKYLNKKYGIDQHENDDVYDEK